MKKLILLLFAFVLVSSFGLTSKSYAQNGPVLYVCEAYGDNGETGISDRFTTGYLTVMVKCDYELGLSSVNIQFDKLDCATGKFKYYKKTPFTIKPTMKYIYFSGKELTFSSPGIYRIYLLDENDKTVTSGLVEIIDK